MWQYVESGHVRGSSPLMTYIEPRDDTVYSATSDYKDYHTYVVTIPICV